MCSHHRCYSRNTILSYRDTLKLFLRFLKEEKKPLRILFISGTSNVNW
ncbi:MAG: site-specific integrase [Blautia wexlerae]